MWLTTITAAATATSSASTEQAKTDNQYRNQNRGYGSRDTDSFSRYANMPHASETNAPIIV